MTRKEPILYNLFFSKLFLKSLTSISANVEIILAKRIILSAHLKFVKHEILSCFLLFYYQNA
jgi:hypothetical protein